MTPNLIKFQKCSLFYANIQGKDENINQLKDKNIMKKLEESIKPVIFETKPPDERELKNIKTYYNSLLIAGPQLALHINALQQEAERQLQQENMIRSFTHR